MSGTSRSGRPAKSVALHQAAGTYRADRHGKAAALQVEGELRRPPGLTWDEGWLWDLIVGTYRGRGVLEKIDAAALRGACELWALYRAAVKAAKAAPGDKDARIATVTYWQAFDRAGSRFGFTPADRARLAIEITAPAGEQPFKSKIVG